MRPRGTSSSASGGLPFVTAAIKSQDIDALRQLCDSGIDIHPAVKALQLALFHKKAIGSYPKTFLHDLYLLDAPDWIHSPCPIITKASFEPVAVTFTGPYISDCGVSISFCSSDTEISTIIVAPGQERLAIQSLTDSSICSIPMIVKADNTPLLLQVQQEQGSDCSINRFYISPFAVRPQELQPSAPALTLF